MGNDPGNPAIRAELEPKMPVYCMSTGEAGVEYILNRLLPVERQTSATQTSLRCVTEPETGERDPRAQIRKL
ncbi:hypothetical protein NDU88_008411 [Pleurodeles waltl]|uniref:Uncharacterized protein n=1 Tax=Pleurodeles waltl TaxID=8319 RepID=A0AAV7ND16_PLEWA|nr:hypothetical protein NDU88_008411 [Pleurodeles waltl]